MKIKTFLIVAIVLMVSCSQSTDEKQNDLTKSVAAETNFKSQYPDVKDVSWEEEGEFKEVEFELDGVEISILYDKDGNFVSKEIEYDVSLLPQAITTYIAKNFPGSDIEEAETFDSKEGSFFEVAIENENDEEVELLFDSDGNFIKETIEAEGKREDHDEEETEENEVEIDISELPAGVLDYLNQNYNNYTIVEAEKETVEGDIFYEVELKGLNEEELDVVFDSEGNFVEVEE